MVNPRRTNLLRDEAATSTTEYAVIIALIAAAIMLGSDAVRLAADSSFRRAAVALGVEPAGPAPASGQDAAGTSADPPLLSIASMPLTHALAWCVLIIAVAIVGHSRYRQRRSQRAVQEIECPAEPSVEEATNPNFAKRQEIQRILLRNFDDAVQSRIEVRHVMSRKLRAVEPTTLLADLRSLMESEGIRHLLVLKQDVLVGVISDRDVKGRSGRRAADVMTANPQTVSPNSQVGPAITAMLHRQISCLPVVESGQVKGILTTSDMLMTLQCLMQLLERANLGQEATEPIQTQTRPRSDDKPAASGWGASPRSIGGSTGA